MEVECAINRYQTGELSLFEASRIVSMHPMEFMHIVIEKNEFKQ